MAPRIQHHLIGQIAEQRLNRLQRKLDGKRLGRDQSFFQSVAQKLNDGNGLVGITFTRQLRIAVGRQAFSESLEALNAGCL